MELIITESQFKNLLSEELGISEFVYGESCKLFSILEKSIADNTKNSIKNEFYGEIKGDVVFPFMNANIKLSYTCYNFFSKDYYEYSKIESSGWSVLMSKNSILAGLVIPCISGTILKSEIMDTIQHELEHCYQQLLMGKRFSGEMEYARMRTNMECNDEFKRDIANMFYACIKSEQDGFINGLYSYLMLQPWYYDEGHLHNSEAWKLYSKSVETYLKYNNMPAFKDELKQYKLTQNKVCKMLNSFVRKIGKVVIKVKHDKISKQGYRF